MKNTAFKRTLSLLLVVVTLLTLETCALAASYNWKQGDSRWSKVSGLTSFSSKGCAVTAIAIQIARSGMVTVDANATNYDPSTGNGFNPGTFAKRLRSAGGLSTKCSVSWGTVSKAVPGFKHATYVDGTGKYTKSKGNGSFSCYPATSNKSVAAAMEMYLQMGYYPVIEGPGSKGAHYVAVIGASEANGTVTIIDPSDGKTKDLFANKKWDYKKLDKQSPANKGKGCCVLFTASGAPLVVQPAPEVVQPAPASVQQEPVQQVVPEPVQQEPVQQVVPEPVQQEPVQQVAPEPVQQEPVQQAVPEPVQQAPESCITISGVAAPSGTMSNSNKFYFKGIVTSQYDLAWVEGGIFRTDYSGVQTARFEGSGKTLDLYKTMDRVLRFKKLPVGNYIYAIAAMDVMGNAVVLIETPFTVV